MAVRTPKPPRKRRRGTGHIKLRQRKDGTWSWQAAFPDPAGQRRSKSGKLVNAELLKTFTSERDAHEWLDEMASAKRRHEFHDPRKADMPFRDAVAAWREVRWARLAPATRAVYSHVLNNHLLDKFGRMPIGAIDRDVCERYVAELEADGTSPAGIQKIFTVLSSVLTRALKVGVIKTHPCSRLDLPRVPRKETVFLTKDEIRAVAAAVDARFAESADWWARYGHPSYTPNMGLYVLLAGMTGLRAGEVVALRRRDYDPLRGLIYVRQALKAVDATDLAEQFGPPKNGKQRTVPVTKEVQTALQAHLAQSSPGGNGPDDLIFVGQTGGVVRHALFYRRHFRPAAKAVLPAEKQACRYHDLRHSCAALLIAAGGHPKQIQEWLGHQQFALTFDRYGHLFAQQTEALASALDAYEEPTTDAASS